MTSDAIPPADAIFTVGAALVSSLQLEEALTTTVEKIGQALDVASVSLWRCSARTRTATFEAYWSHDGYPPYDPEHVGMVTGLDERPTFAALVDRRTTNEYHDDDPGLLRSIRVAMSQRDIRSMIEAPLVVADEVMGVLVLAETRALRRFTDSERRLLDELCLLAAIGIRNADLYREQEEQKRRLVSLLESSRATAVSLGAQHAVETLKLEVARLMPQAEFELDLAIDLGGGQMELFVSETAGGELTMESLGAPPDEPAKQALAEQRAVQLLAADHVRLVVPLELRRGVSGYVDLRAPLAREFTVDEIAFIQTLAHHASAAFEQARLQRHIASRSVVDAKTGLYTQAFFHDRLFSELARADRYDEPVALLLMSVDDIKDYRDAEGAPAGEAVIRALGRFLKRNLRRRIDLACRSGENQFAIALPNTGLDSGAAAKGAERLRSKIQATTFVDEDEHSLGVVTVTQGIACYPNHGHDAMELTTAAEGALRQARTTGQNKIEVATTQAAGPAMPAGDWRRGDEGDAAQIIDGRDTPEA